MEKIEQIQKHEIILKRKQFELANLILQVFLTVFFFICSIIFEIKYSQEDTWMVNEINANMYIFHQTFLNMNYQEFAVILSLIGSVFLFITVWYSIHLFRKYFKIVLI